MMQAALIGVAKQVALNMKKKGELHLFLAICIGISLNLAGILTVNVNIHGRQLCSCSPFCND